MKIFNIMTIICTILISLLAFQFSQAQTLVGFGAKAGANFSTLRGDDAVNTKRRTGFTGGVFLSISPQPFFTIQPEVLFSQRGAINTNEALNIRQELRVNYIDIPILFKLRIPIDETFFPHVYIGPQFSRRLGNKYTVEQLDVNVQINEELTVRKFDFGGVFGAGLDIQSNNLILTFDFRYGIGALNLDDDDNGLDLKNSDLMFFVGIGYLFAGK